MHKKNAILVFLLFLMLMPLVFAVYSIIEKELIEDRMRERLEQENLQTVTINAASVIWLKANEELLINGEPFDLKTITRNGTSITVQGLYDLQEKELETQLQAYQYPESKSSPADNSLLLLILTSFYQANEPIGFHTPFFIYKKQTWQKHQNKICNLYHEIVIPPPRLL